jgi:hypothetical protein
LTQLSFILDSTATFDDTPLLFQFNGGDSKSVGDAKLNIDNALSSISIDCDFRVVLISGNQSSTRESFTFGTFVQGLSDNAQIVDCQDKNLERILLFQLGPIYDIFRSNIGSKAWTVTDGVCFSEPNAGFSMKLGNGLNKLYVYHRTASEGVYQSTKWRGTWELVLDIDRVEIRGM